MYCFTAKKKGIYDHVIINDDLDDAYSQLKDILSKVLYPPAPISSCFTPDKYL